MQAILYNLFIKAFKIISIYLFPPLPTVADMHHLGIPMLLY